MSIELHAIAIAAIIYSAATIVSILITRYCFNNASFESNRNNITPAGTIYCGIAFIIIGIYCLFMAGAAWSHLLCINVK